MVRLVADPLYQYLISTFPATRPYPRQALQRSPMPPLVARYLDRALDQRLKAEEGRLAAARTEWFDYRHPDVEDAHRVLLETAGRHARIPASEWPGALREAVGNVTSYLVHPTRTLPDFVFSDSDGVVPTSAVLHRMRHFGAYRYLEDAVSTYLEQKNAQEIDRARFSSIIAHVDRQMTEEHKTADWLQLLEPLLSLVRMVPELADGVPLPLLRSFFNAKRAAVVERRLAFVAENQGVEALDEEGLRRLLDGPEDRFEPSVGRRNEHSTPETSYGEGPLPLWKKFQHGGREEPEVLVREPSPSPAVERPGSNAVPLWKKFRSTVEDGRAPTERAEKPPAELPALERTVLGERGLRNRSLFVKHLFGGSSDAYEYTLKRLSRATSWPQASQIIAEDIFLKNQINIYSEPAVAFTDAVEARFNV
jgi:hypothetical protein